MQHFSWDKACCRQRLRLRLIEAVGNSKIASINFVSDTLFSLDLVHFSFSDDIHHFNFTQASSGSTAPNSLSVASCASVISVIPDISKVLLFNPLL